MFAASAADNLLSYELGLARVDPGVGTLPTSGDASTEYYHGDQIGTTRTMSDSTGASFDDVVYTAFGQPVSGADPRYGYAGAWGYQAHDDFPFQHVGARYYDPATGRLLQRDSAVVLTLDSAVVLTLENPYALPNNNPVGGGGKRPGPRNELTPDDNYPRHKNDFIDSNKGYRVRPPKPKPHVPWYKRAWRKVKKIVPKIAKRAAKKIPVVAAGCFAYDWYNDGFEEAVREATWPFSEGF